MAAKSSRAFRTISEAAEELGLKPHVLRFWEAKFTEIQPLTRAGGRRFYRPEDIDFLHGLRILLHDEKHKIKDVQRIIRMKGTDEIMRLGAAAAARKESRPIAERDLVPNRIQPTLARPEPEFQAQYEPAPAPASPPVSPPILRPAPVAAQPNIVPFTPRDPAPAPVAAAPIPMPAPQSAPELRPQPQPQPAPALSAEKTQELEGAIDRLSLLRSRLKKFTE